jgi:hypothetical protein
MINATAARAKSNSLLIGRIYDDRGNRMSPSHARKQGIKYRYYVSSPLLQGEAGRAGSVRRVLRRERPTGGRRNLIYTYLAPVGVGDAHADRKGDVLSFSQRLCGALVVLAPEKYNSIAHWPC